MSLLRRSRRQAEATIDRFQRADADFSPETTSGWERVWEAQNTVLMTSPPAAEQEEEADELVIAPDRELLPSLNILLNTVYVFNSFIKRHRFNNRQDLEKKKQNYEAILYEFINNVMGSFPRMTVYNFETVDGNNLIESVFRHWQNLVEYFQRQEHHFEDLDSNFGTPWARDAVGIHWNIGEGSAGYRTKLINSIKLLKEHIEKEHPMEAPRGGKKSRKRRRKKSIKRRRKKKSGVTRRKKSPRTRCK